MTTNLSMIKNQYILLTGSKNNAGDFLIKSRAKELFSILKPDVKLIDINAWEDVDKKTLAIINESKAVILLGGPSLQKKMYPKIYKLTPDIDDISAPIISMGIGWYSPEGDWKNTQNYPLSENSIKLLKKINNSGYKSSVRDYHTKNVLNSLGLNNFLMTGCPALYDESSFNKEIQIPTQIKTIGYSLGAAIKSSPKMFKQMQQVFLQIVKTFPNAEIETAFHHSPSEKYLNAAGSNLYFHQQQVKFKNWLENNNQKWVDISGSADNLKNYYKSVDLHIGYRVHAHIFMSSISKPSVLISEDGRGKALEKVLGGVILESIDKINTSLLDKVFKKFNLHIDDIKPLANLPTDLQNFVKYELKSGVKFKQPRIEIDRHYSVMKTFIDQLP